jgi:hypothetical protein
MKQFFSVLILTAILFSCKKSATESNTYTLTGIVADFDNKTVIAGAQVYVGIYGIKNDSAISGANGWVSFSLLKADGVKILTASKLNYLLPSFSAYNAVSTEDRTDSIFLVRPSFVNLTTHKANVYLSTDSITLSVNNVFTPGPATTSSDYKEILRDKTDIADKNFIFSTIYQAPPTSGLVIQTGYQKVYFKWDIIRSGSVLSSKLDSVALIQFGTKNFTINY